MDLQELPRMSALVHLDRESASPLYVQVADGIRTSIDQGQLSEGQRLPSENEASDELGVSRPTLRQAFRMLENEGLIVRSRASGTRVRRPQGAVAAPAPLPAATERARTGVRYIGMVVPDWTNPFFISLCAGVERAARVASMRVSVTDVMEDRRVERRTLRQMQRDCDVTVAVAPRLDDAEITELLDPHRTVLVNRAVPGFRSVNVDATTGISQAVGHLVALGHACVGYVAGPASSRASGALAEHVEKEVLARDADFLLFGPVEPTIGGGASIADEVLNSEATAVVTHNDLVALGMISYAKSRGASIPGDLSVIGFDNIPFDPVADPPLTSVAVRDHEVGRLVVHEISEMLEGSGGHPGVVQLGSELHMRKSTARPGG
ncbi:substrate-binding domain-containing protein [Brachybacterium sp. sponge]|uniref:GntR family transcriptional regulator n=1 Tax=Brachybacterium sp. sponge TaxID=1775432 RepID=UPI0007A4E77D|nr:GntR family transcriptional regulator [Brachybacterium sp. sponge]